MCKKKVSLIFAKLYILYFTFVIVDNFMIQNPQ